MDCRLVAGHAALSDHQGEREHQGGHGRRRTARRLDQAIGSERAFHRAQKFHRTAQEPGQFQGEERREQQTGKQREQNAREEGRPPGAERKAGDGQRGGEQRDVAPQAILTGAEHLVAALLQRLNRFDAGGVARRNEGRHDAGPRAHGHGEQEEARVGRHLLHVLRDAEHGFQHVGGDAGKRAREDETEGGSGRGTNQSGDRAFAEKERADLSASGAEGAQNADLRAPLRDCDGEGIVDDEHPDEEREHAGRGHRQGVYAEQRFELAAAARRRLDGEARPQQRGQARPCPAAG